MNFAVVKQDVYDDYWACSSSASPEEIVFSSMMRVGQAALFIDLGATPYIVREEPETECQIWTQKTSDFDKKLWVPAVNYRMLKTMTLNQIPGQSHKHPGSPYPPGKFAVDCKTINWSRYNVVICHDIPVPAYITRANPKTLWCYMIQEPFMKAFQGLIINGYDVRLNQKLASKVQETFGEVDFPSAFLTSSTLFKLMAKVLNRPPLNKGIYPEINMCNGRPVRTVPYADRLSTFGEILIHHQDIRENLTRLYDAKYFVKIGGRFIRGNAVIEAISSNTLVIANPKDIIYNSLLPSECFADNIDSVCAKLQSFENNPYLYQNVLEEQKRRVQRYCYDIPLQTLQILWEKKQ